MTLFVCRETYVTKDVSEGWEKEWDGRQIYNECTYHSSGQVISFRTDEVNIVYNLSLIHI